MCLNPKLGFWAYKLILNTAQLTLHCTKQAHAHPKDPRFVMTRAQWKAKPVKLRKDACSTEDVFIFTLLHTTVAASLRS